MSILTIPKWPSQIVMNGSDRGTYRFEAPNDGNVYFFQWTLTLGGKTVKDNLTNPGDTRQFPAFPTDWCSEIPNSTSGIAQVKIITKKQIAFGVFIKVEETHRTIKMIVPDNIVPTVSNVTTERIDGSVPPDWGVYVERFSSCKLTAAASSLYGATISGYKFQLDGFGLLSGHAGNEYTYKCARAGNLNFQVTATDSRGRTSAPYQVSIKVEPHNRPLIRTINAYRCDADGNEKGNGTYAAISVGYSISSVAGHNTALAKAFYYEPGRGWAGESSVINNQTAVVFGVLDPDSSQRIKVAITDALSESDYELDLVSLGSTVELMYGGDGLSFGKSAELHGYLDNAYKAFFRQGIEFPKAGWKPLELINGATIGEYGRTPEYQVLGNIVRLRGDLAAISERTPVSKLPPEARPENYKYFLSSGSSGFITLWRISPNGDITPFWSKNFDNTDAFDRTDYFLDYDYLT